MPTISTTPESLTLTPEDVDFLARWTLVFADEWVPRTTDDPLAIEMMHTQNWSHLYWTILFEVEVSGPRVRLDLRVCAQAVQAGYVLCTPEDLERMQRKASRTIDFD